MKDPRKKLDEECIGRVSALSACDSKLDARGTIFISEGDLLEPLGDLLSSVGCFLDEPRQFNLPTGGRSA